MVLDCGLDLLPVELLHTVFTYFSTPEILRIFTDISTYVNSVLMTYTRYQVDQSSIRLTDLELIRDRLLPEQVTSLIVSDEDRTLVASDVFLSHFRVEQFTHLRSLVLVQIDIQTVKSIFAVLHMLKHLQYLSFNIDAVRHRFPTRNGDYANGSFAVKALLSKSYARVFPQLNHICLNCSTDVITVPLPNLHMLKLDSCSLHDLKIILRDIAQLKSLDIRLNAANASADEFALPLNRLLRLRMKIRDQRISREHVEQLLHNSSHWKHLILEADVIEDVADGLFWQDLTKSFITFHFLFDVPHIYAQQVLSSFRIPFWRDEKHWYVAYQNEHLFTLPYFAPKHVESLNLSQASWTAPDPSLFFSQATELTVGAQFSTTDRHRCQYIETLTFDIIVSEDTLQQALDMQLIKHLTISSMADLLRLPSLQYSMPRLDRLTIRNSVTLSAIERIRHRRLTQIRILQMSLARQNVDCIMEELFLIFSHVEFLICKSPIQSIRTMNRFMSGFRNLSKASFCASGSFYCNESRFCRNPNSGNPYATRYAFHVYHLTNTPVPLSIQCRVKKQTTVSLSWRRGNRWYRSKYIATQLFNSHFTLLSHCIEFLVYFLIVVVTHIVYERFEMRFCLLKTIFITAVYQACRRLFRATESDNIYVACLHKLYLWFVFGLIVFVISFFGQTIYDTTVESVHDRFV